jgi:protoheme ferro-lyase
MASKNIAVYGIYRTRPMVEKAVEALKHAGFRNADISVLFPESGGTKEFAIEKETKAPEGANVQGLKISVLKENPKQTMM